MKIKLSKTSNLPVYLQIRDAISQEIVEGRLGPNEKLPTETELASELGVNRLTISHSYEALERKGIINQQRGRGSFIVPNVSEILGIPKRLMLRNVGFALGASCESEIPNVIKFIFFDMLSGIASRLGESHINLSHLMIGNEPGQIPKVLRQRLDSFDGFILLSSFDVAAGFASTIQGLNIPCVYIGGHYDGMPGIPFIYHDRAHGVHLAVEHLVNCGYRRIGFVGMDDRQEQKTDSKLQGFFTAMAKFNLTVQANHVLKAGLPQGEAHRAMYECVKAGDLPEAFFVDTDYKAIEVISVLKSFGKSVPEDVAVVGYDNIPDAKTFDPPLTTISIPRRQVGWEAADMLINWPVDGPAPESRVLKSELIVRGSTGLAGGQKTTAIPVQGGVTSPSLTLNASVKKSSPSLV